MKSWLRAVAAVTLFCFVTTQCVSAAPGAGIEMSGLRETPSFLSIDVPSELGTVDSLYEAPSGANPQFVLHIQNAHANYEAQMKIKQLLSYMDQHYGFKTIFVEGASEKLDADSMRLFPDEARNLKLCDGLAKKGELTGAELYLMEKTGLRGDAIEAFGIEEAALYRSNYNALKKVFGAETDIDHFFEGFDGKMDRVSSKVFTPEARELIADWKRFEQGRRAFMPFVKTLVQKSKKLLKVDLESLFAQVGWPQITRLLVIQRLEKDLDRIKALEEKKALLEVLRQKSASKELMAVLESFNEGNITVGKSTKEISPREILERLASEMGPKGFKFSDYPSFSLFAGYVALKAELDPKILFAEIEYLFTQMLDTLAKEPEQKSLLALYRDGELVRKLLHLELNRADWKQVVAAKERLTIPALVSRLKECVQVADGGGRMAEGVKTGFAPSSISATNRRTDPSSGGHHPISQSPVSLQSVSDVMPSEFAKTMDELFATGLEFYDFAHQREAVFYKEMQGAMKDRKISKAILITGGFHTDGMSDLFRDHDVSYGIVTPRLSEKSDENLYRKIMLQKNAGAFEISYLEAILKMEPLAAQFDQGGGDVTPIVQEFMAVANISDPDQAVAMLRETAETTGKTFLNGKDGKAFDIIKVGGGYRLVPREQGAVPVAGQIGDVAFEAGSIGSLAPATVPAAQPAVRSEVRGGKTRNVIALWWQSWKEWGMVDREEGESYFSVTAWVVRSLIGFLYLTIQKWLPDLLKFVFLQAPRWIFYKVTNKTPPLAVTESADKFEPDPEPGLGLWEASVMFVLLMVALYFAGQWAAPGISGQFENAPPTIQEIVPSAVRSEMRLGSKVTLGALSFALIGLLLTQFYLRSQNQDIEARLGVATQQLEQNLDLQVRLLAQKHGLFDQHADFWVDDDGMPKYGIYFFPRGDIRDWQEEVRTGKITLDELKQRLEAYGVVRKLAYDLTCPVPTLEELDEFAKIYLNEGRDKLKAVMLEEAVQRSRDVLMTNSFLESLNRSEVRAGQVMRKYVLPAVSVVLFAGLGLLALSNPIVVNFLYAALQLPISASAFGVVMSVIGAVSGGVLGGVIALWKLTKHVNGEALKHVKALVAPYGLLNEREFSDHFTDQDLKNWVDLPDSELKQTFLDIAVIRALAEGILMDAKKEGNLIATPPKIQVEILRDWASKLRTLHGRFPNIERIIGKKFEELQRFFSVRDIDEQMGEEERNEWERFSLQFGYFLGTKYGKKPALATDSSSLKRSEVRSGELTYLEQTALWDTLAGLKKPLANEIKNVSTAWIKSTSSELAMWLERLNSLQDFMNKLEKLEDIQGERAKGLAKSLDDVIAVRESLSTGYREPNPSLDQTVDSLLKTLDQALSRRSEMRKPRQNLGGERWRVKTGRDGRVSVVRESEGRGIVRKWRPWILGALAIVSVGVVAIEHYLGVLEQEYYEFTVPENEMLAKVLKIPSSDSILFDNLRSLFNEALPELKANGILSEDSYDSYGVVGFAEYVRDFTPEDPDNKKLPPDLVLRIQDLSAQIYQLSLLKSATPEARRSEVRAVSLVFGLVSALAVSGLMIAHAGLAEVSSLRIQLGLGPQLAPMEEGVLFDSQDPRIQDKLAALASAIAAARGKEVVVQWSENGIVKSATGAFMGRIQGGLITLMDPRVDVYQIAASSVLNVALASPASRSEARETSVPIGMIAPGTPEYLLQSIKIQADMTGDSVRSLFALVERGAVNSQEFPLFGVSRPMEPGETAKAFQESLAEKILSRLGLPGATGKPLEEEKVQWTNKLKRSPDEIGKVLKEILAGIEASAAGKNVKILDLRDWQGAAERSLKALFPLIARVRTLVEEIEKSISAMGDPTDPQRELVKELEGLRKVLAPVVSEQLVTLDVARAIQATLKDQGEAFRDFRAMNRDFNGALSVLIHRTEMAIFLSSRSEVRADLVGDPIRIASLYYAIDPAKDLAEQQPKIEAFRQELLQGLEMVRSDAVQARKGQDAMEAGMFTGVIAEDVPLMDNEFLTYLRSAMDFIYQYNSTSELLSLNRSLKAISENVPNWVNPDAAMALEHLEKIEKTWSEGHGRYVAAAVKFVADYETKRGPLFRSEVRGGDERRAGGSERRTSISADQSREIQRLISGAQTRLKGTSYEGVIDAPMASALLAVSEKDWGAAVQFIQKAIVALTSSNLEVPLSARLSGPVTDLNSALAIIDPAQVFARAEVRVAPKELDAVEVVAQRQKLAESAWALLSPVEQGRASSAHFIYDTKSLTGVLGQIMVPSDLKNVTPQQIANMIRSLVALKAGQLDAEKFLSLAKTILQNPMMSVSHEAGAAIIVTSEFDRARLEETRQQLIMNTKQIVVVLFTGAGDEVTLKAWMDDVRKDVDITGNSIGSRFSLKSSAKALVDMRNTALEILHANQTDEKHITLLVENMTGLNLSNVLGTVLESRDAKPENAGARSLLAMRVSQTSVDQTNRLLFDQVGGVVLKQALDDSGKMTAPYQIDENLLTGLAKLWAELMGIRATSIAA